MKIKIGGSLSGKSVNRKKLIHPFTYLPIYLSVLIFTFAFFTAPLPSLAEDVEDIYESRLDSGMKNTEPYSYVLIKKAKDNPAIAKNLLREAVKYSPDLPAVYFEMAKKGFSFSQEGIFESFDYTMQGFKAYKRNFWWLRGITGLLFISLLCSFVVAIFVVICIRFFIDVPLLSHDIEEDKKKILVVLSLIPFSFLGPLFFIAGALSLLGLYFRKSDKIIVYLSILLLLLSPLFLHTVNVFFSAPPPELKAVVAVNEGRNNKYAISALKDKNDFVSLFSYGLALKREGRYEEAIEAYKALLSISPDPKAYVNLGNCYFSINDMNTARDLYKKAVELKPFVSAYYNLSQVSREKLDFAKVEEYFREAARLNREAISSFIYTTSKNTNRFIIDETLPMSTLWKYANSRYQRSVRISPLGSSIAFVIAIILGIVFYRSDARTKYRAYRCQRCDAIQCGKCAKEILWGQMCSQCYKSIVKLDALDSKDRIAKVLEVQELQGKRRNIVRILSFALPGVAHIYAEKILIGTLFLWLFLFPLVLISLNPLFFMGLSLFSHGWLIAPSLILMAVLYLLSNITIRRKLNRGWL